LPHAAWRAAPITIFFVLTRGTAWDGSPLVLMPQQIGVVGTPNGSVILTYENLAAQNNAGTIKVDTGGSTVDLPVPAQQHQPSFVVKNFAAQQLTVKNTSVAPETPIRVQEVGTGIPGTAPVTIPIDGTVVHLPPGATASTLAVPRLMQIMFSNTSNNTSDVVMIGGPTDAYGNNGYAIEVNSIQTTGPPSRTPATAPFNATTTSNFFVVPFRWGSSTVFVANLSSDNAGPVDVTLVSL
jgi:hypothetical protein